MRLYGIIQFIYRNIYYYIVREKGNPRQEMRKVREMARFNCVGARGEVSTYDVVREASRWVLYEVLSDGARVRLGAVRTRAQALEAMNTVFVQVSGVA